ncbi:MAG: T9SS type A sorting domain-containing protein [Paludibacter sp.]|jgi:pectate lyase|nr:T9SS type A sorting domain-containing protein [Paludibacter sp.]
MKKLSFTLLLACVSIFGMQAQIKAFPTAEGFGSLATGGRGGQVVEVTNLDDNPTAPSVGSLRWALTQYPGQPITVVFRVSGIINLAGAKAGELRCNRANWTLAGQTAPGDGICIMGNKVNFGGSTNLIIRHLRFRIGTMIDPITGEPDASGKGSIGIENSSNWIIDHCTFGWSGEENMTIYDNWNTTIQWSIVHEGLYQSGHNKGNRGYGCQWGGQNATFHHNLLANNHNRAARLNGARSNDINVLIDYVNNVNYNWGKTNSCYGSDIEKVSNHTNFVNNYYKPGPAYPGTSRSYFTHVTRSSNQTAGAVAKWYMSGNYMEGSANAVQNTNNYLGLRMTEYSAAVIADSASYISATPFAISLPVVTQTAQEAYVSVLAGAGAFPRDTVDRRIIYETSTGTASGSGVFGTHKGIIDAPSAVGGYPTYNTYNTIIDADHDGMDDAWETANGLNPANAADRNFVTESGYTVLEVYLNSLVGESIPLSIVNAVKNATSETISMSYADGKLQISSTTSSNINLTIFDVTGRQILQSKSLNSKYFDVSALAKGIYIAKAENTENENYTLKFSK